jgi:hypothetical protein
MQTQLRQTAHSIVTRLLPCNSWRRCLRVHLTVELQGEAPVGVLGLDPFDSGAARGP